MDALQFGRWLSERRRSVGLPSQRSLVEASRQNPMLHGYEISEDFLARLEAGHFAYPFRKTVRQRVLALAWLLCKTPRDVQAYLRAARLSELSGEETEQIHRLNGYLAAFTTPAPLLLPPRPSHVVGRTAGLDELLRALGNPDIDTCVVTGMAGVGKSVLASEALHRLVSNQYAYAQLFPDGIITLTGTGRRDEEGLISLLQELARVLSKPGSLVPGDTPAPSARRQRSHRNSVPASLASPDPVQANNLAGAIDHARLALANKRVLLFLDDVSADFPLRRALEVLVSYGSAGAQRSKDGNRNRREHCAVLITSRYMPTSALVSHHLHLTALKPSDALELFAFLVGQQLQEQELIYAEQICAAVGYHPLALEIAATAIVTKGIPLFLLATHVSQQPLDSLLDGEHELYAMLAEALAPLGSEMQRRFVLLSTLDVPLFDLEHVAAMHMPENPAPSPKTGILLLPEHGLSLLEDTQPISQAATDTFVDLPQLATTAAELGQFVRHSLLELVPDDALTASSSLVDHTQAFQHNFPRYALPPLLRAYALKRLEDLDQVSVGLTRQNIQRYALQYMEQYHADGDRLKRKRDFLLSAFKQAWNAQNYGNVVRFAHVLTSFSMVHYSASREVESMLLYGIYASRQVQDRSSMVCFLNRLGILFLHRGEFARARRTLEESVEVASSLSGPVPAHLWVSYSFLAHLAHMQGELDAAQQLVEAYLQRLQQAEEPCEVFQGLYLRGFYRRITGDIEHAYSDLSESLRLFSLSATSSEPGSDDFVSTELRMEIARIQGDYPHSRTYAEAAVEHVLSMDDHYMAADLLFDQADYAARVGEYGDARDQVTRAIDEAAKAGAYYHRSRSIALLHSLSVEPARRIFS
ncbi:MAG TPA: tetratricopeptide repeat protein [Ktedonobacteraceae bacterium]|nr:tetratricopeptide repeat protein [Ktedonobacteraceae bacterium]